MKYAITGPRGLIRRIVDEEPTDAPHYSEISDADAATVEASEGRFFIVDGVLLTMDEFRAAKQQERYEAQITEFGADIDGAKAFVRDHFASKRYDVEVGGIGDVNGISIRTDRFTVERIYQARFLASADPSFTTEWKLGDGSFITVDATSIIGISDAITLHIQASFSREKTINTSIDAATTLAELQAITW
jgi:hypothetical protein